MSLDTAIREAVRTGDPRLGTLMARAGLVGPVHCCPKPQVSEGDFVIEARRLRPRSRGEFLFRYIRTGRRTVRECRLCGLKVSWSGDWPRTRSSIEEEYHHVMEHVDEALERGESARAHVLRYLEGEAS